MRGALDRRARRAASRVPAPARAGRQRGRGGAGRGHRGERDPHARRGSPTCCTGAGRPSRRARPLADPDDVAREGPDLADVRGQEDAKRALEIAAAGGHNLLMVGPPGAGKTMLARRLPGILPPPSFEEALEITQVHSAAGIGDGRLATERPFRAPHHTISAQGLVGGGSGRGRARSRSPTAASCSSTSCPSSRAARVDALRQPLEEGRVEIMRGQRTLEFPANAIVVAACNRCPCARPPTAAAAPRSSWRATCAGSAARCWTASTSSARSSPCRPCELVDGSARAPDALDGRARAGGGRARAPARAARRAPACSATATWTAGSRAAGSAGGEPGGPPARRRATGSRSAAAATTACCAWPGRSPTSQGASAARRERPRRGALVPARQLGAAGGVIDALSTSCLRRAFLVALPRAADRRAARRPAADGRSRPAGAARGRAARRCGRAAGGGGARISRRHSTATAHASGLAAGGFSRPLPPRGRYPPLLRELPDPPAVLFAAGRSEAFAVLREEPAVAVVGTRRASPYGTEVAYALGRGLGAAGVPVVSGLALGIDATAHRGCLDGGGVAAGRAGLRAGRRRIRAATAASTSACASAGSSCPSSRPAREPYRWSFPARNRIMAGLARMTLVVEAADPSGSLITRGLRARPRSGVAAVPGRVTSRGRAGTNSLLRDGAVADHRHRGRSRRAVRRGVRQAPAAVAEPSSRPRRPAAARGARGGGGCGSRRRDRAHDAAERRPRCVPPSAASRPTGTSCAATSAAGSGAAYADGADGVRAAVSCRCPWPPTASPPRCSPSPARTPAAARASRRT